MFSIGVFAIIFDEYERVLLCHRRDYDAWNLPGGGLDSGESPSQGVIREVKEEIGLEVEVVRLVGVYSKPKDDDIVFLFICKIIGGQLQTTEEAKAVEYFAYDDIPTNTITAHIERIKDALKHLDTAIIKEQ